MIAVDTYSSSFAFGAIATALLFVAPVLQRYGGNVVKNLGDSYMALFPAATDAVRAALDLVETIPEQGQFSIRVGIATGPVVAGNVGGGGRQTYTAHGDTVNMAARLETLNKVYGTTILLDEPTVQAIAGELPAPLAQIAVRGQSREMRLFDAASLPEGK